MKDSQINWYEDSDGDLFLEIISKGLTTINVKFVYIGEETIKSAYDAKKLVDLCYIEQKYSGKVKMFLLESNFVIFNNFTMAIKYDNDDEILEIYNISDTLVELLENFISQLDFISGMLKEVHQEVN